MGRCAASPTPHNMKSLMGYLRTLRRYFDSPKGRHDLIDCLYAGISFILVTVIALIILSIVR